MKRVRFVQGLGLIALLHDRRDIGRFDRLHHWLLGAVMVLRPKWFLFGKVR